MLVSATNVSICSSTDCALCSSKFPVGSSANKSLGSVTNARAIATLCCCPPDKASGYFRIWSDKPREDTIFSNLILSTGPDKFAWKLMFAATFNDGIRLKCWNIIAMSFRLTAALPVSSILDNSLPSISTLPASGNSSAPAMCKRVLFPLPDSPLSASVSPARRVKLTSFRTDTLPSLVRYDFRIEFKLRTIASLA